MRGIRIIELHVHVEEQQEHGDRGGWWTTWRAHPPACERYGKGDPDPPLQMIGEGMGHLLTWRPDSGQQPEPGVGAHAGARGRQKSA